MITETIRIERTIDEMVDKATRALQKNEPLRDITIDHKDAVELHLTLAKTGIQIDKIKDNKIYVKPLDAYCNCLKLGIDCENYICQYHKALVTLGPQYWYDGERIVFDMNHPAVKGVGFLGCKISATNTRDLRKYLAAHYGQCGNEKKDLLARQCRL